MKSRLFRAGVQFVRVKTSLLYQKSRVVICDTNFKQKDYLLFICMSIIYSLLFSDSSSSQETVRSTRDSVG